MYQKKEKHPKANNAHQSVPKLLSNFNYYCYEFSQKTLTMDHVNSPTQGWRLLDQESELATSALSIKDELLKVSSFVLVYLLAVQFLL